MSNIIFRNGKSVGEGAAPYIIAELNTSHFGKVEVAKEMILSAKNIGADCVKFQSWTDETLYSKSYYEANPIAQRFVKRYSLSEEELSELVEYCKEVDIDFSSTPYSENEVDFLVENTIAPFIKIASMELNNLPFLKYIGSKGVPVILSTGMGTFEEIEQAVSTLEESGNNQIVILHCISIYPAEPEITNLRNITKLKERFPEYVIGFSDHSVGPELAAASIAMGSSVIEKHFTLDQSKIGMDNQMAMETESFEEMVTYCHRVSNALGSYDRVLTDQEIEQRKNMRRSVVSTRELPKGHILIRSDLTLKRPGTGIQPEALDSLIGCEVNEDIEADTLIKAETIITNHVLQA